MHIVTRKIQHVVRSMGFENRVRLDGGLSWEVNLDPGTVWSLDAYLVC